MKLLANENIPAKSVHFLRGKGFDIISIGVDDPGISDAAVMTIAINQEESF